MKKFSIVEESGVLTLSTTGMSQDRGSVLHSGIYNRDTASALAAFCLAAPSALFALKFSTLSALIVFFLVGVGGYPVLRAFVFRESFLETVFDPGRNSVSVLVNGMRRSLADSFQITDIKNVLIETRKLGVANPDGVEFVEKISAQHGTVIPGFAEERTLYMLTLKLGGGKDVVVYSDDVMQDVLDAHEKIKRFLNI